MALSHIEWVRRSEGKQGLWDHRLSWDGTVAPQCGICSDKGENNRTGEQPLLRQYTRGYLCATLIKNTLPGNLVESLKGGSLW